ncbi:hypothetical protein QFZ40_002248 [Arthrobacter pascens]|nr:hypothetical protein [Arthrobacter pascens]
MSGEHFVFQVTMPAKNIAHSCRWSMGRYYRPYVAYTRGAESQFRARGRDLAECRHSNLSGAIGKPQLDAPTLAGPLQPLRSDHQTVARWPVGGVCGYCYQQAKRTRGICACGHEGVLPGLIDNQPACRRCSGIRINIDLTGIFVIGVALQRH